MKYLIIDACLNGTGIRDYYEGGYISPESLELSPDIIRKLKTWLTKYENEHYHGYKNDSVIDELDKEGKEIALDIKNELTNAKVMYFSDARSTKDFI